MLRNAKRSGIGGGGDGDDEEDDEDAPTASTASTASARRQTDYANVLEALAKVPSLRDATTRARRWDAVARAQDALARDALAQDAPEGRAYDARALARTLDAWVRAPRAR